MGMRCFVKLIKFLKLFNLLILFPLLHGLHFCNPAYKDLWDL